MFGLGPAYVFFVTHRLPLGEMKSGWRPWFSTMGTNLTIAVIVVGMMLLVGVRTFLVIQIPITLTAAGIGVWLFYIQHQYEGVAWVRSPNWSLRKAALTGSSHYHLPGPLGWITANIGVHHIHHLSSRIPFYRLRQVLRDHPELDANRLTMAQSLRGVSLALWDEARQKLISFRELRHGPSGAGRTLRLLARSAPGAQHQPSELSRSTLDIVQVLPKSGRPRYTRASSVSSERSSILTR